MRQLWPIERAILEVMIAENPSAGAALRRQIDSARVTSFENSGAGFFSELNIADRTLLLDVQSPLDAAQGTVVGVTHGMGFIVFVKDGCLSMIEGYCNAPDATAEIDFSRVGYQLTPWQRMADENRPPPP